MTQAALHNSDPRLKKLNVEIEFGEEGRDKWIYRFVTRSLISQAMKHVGIRKEDGIALAWCREEFQKGGCVGSTGEFGVYVQRSRSTSNPFSNKRRRAGQIHNEFTRRLRCQEKETFRMACWAGSHLILESDGKFTLDALGRKLFPHATRRDRVSQRNQVIHLVANVAYLVKSSVEASESHRRDVVRVVEDAKFI